MGYTVTYGERYIPWDKLFEEETYMSICREVHKNIKSFEGWSYDDITHRAREEIKSYFFDINRSIKSSETPFFGIHAEYIFNGSEYGYSSRGVDASDFIKDMIIPKDVPYSAEDIIKKDVFSGFITMPSQDNPMPSIYIESSYENKNTDLIKMRFRHVSVFINVKKLIESGIINVVGEKNTSEFTDKFTPEEFYERIQNHPCFMYLPLYLLKHYPEAKQLIETFVTKCNKVVDIESEKEQLSKIMEEIIAKFLKDNVNRYGYNSEGAHKSMEMCMNKILRTCIDFMYPDKDLEISLSYEPNNDKNIIYDLKVKIRKKCEKVL